MSIIQNVIEENTSEFKIIKVNELSKDCNAIDFDLKQNSKATILIVHDSKEAPDYSIKTNFKLMKNSKLTVIDVLISNKNSSLNQEIYLKENNSSVKSTVIFLGEKDQTINVQTKIWHQADNTKGNLLCRGVLQNNSKADFLAQITVPYGIKNIESHQNMKCLTQGESASCDALPILDVNSDSVICSHGVAIGRVEEESLFYLQSRGLSEKEAQVMVLYGFLMQELAAIKESSPKIYQKIDKSIREKLRK